MKKRTVFAALLVVSLIASGCSEKGKQPEGEGSEKTAVQNETENEPNQSGSELAEKESCAMRWDRIPMVRVKGENYFDSGYISSAARCGVPDGQIRSSIDGSQLPEEEDQSNFGSGYNYQFCGEEGILVVEIDGRQAIFVREDKRQGTDIPSNVAHFEAELIGKGERGGLLLRLTKIPADFQHLKLQTGDEIFVAEDRLAVSSEESVLEEGTAVQLWFDGKIKEGSPKEIEKVYRIVY